jgi:polyhydroxyalkanoate synthesis regulator phasin
MNDLFNMSNKMFDLAYDYYYSVVNSVLWSQERMLGMTKTMVAQVEASQNEGKKLVSDFTDQAKKTQALFQEVWQEGVKSATSNINAFRVASDAAVVELDRKIDVINEKLATTAPKKAPVSAN